MLNIEQKLKGGMSQILFKNVIRIKINFTSSIKFPYVLHKRAVPESVVIKESEQLKTHFQNYQNLNVF